MLVIPVAAPFKEYASEVAKTLWDAGIYSDADLSDSTLPKKIRNGELAQHNFILGMSLVLSIYQITIEDNNIGVLDCFLILL